MKTIIGSVVASAFACALSIAVAADKEPVKSAPVAKILSIDLAIEKIQPPNLVVTAVGEASTPGYTGYLSRVVYIMPPADGIQDYKMTATPPAGIVPQVISTVTGTDRWEGYEKAAPWLKGVRIHGVDKGVMVKMLDERKAK